MYYMQQTGGKDVSMYCFPPKTNPSRQQQWVMALGMKEEQLQDHHHVCSHHFPNGDVSQVPSLHHSTNNVSFQASPRLHTSSIKASAQICNSSSVQACSLLANYEPDHILVSKFAHCLANGRLRGHVALIACAWYVMHAKRSGKILRAS